MIDTEALRNKVIDLAIQGKLTEQLPSDGDAETVYAQIQEEKAKLVKEGKIKKEKPLPPISEDEIPFEIPDNWKWVRLGDISAVISKGTTPRGGNVAYLDSGIGFLRVENLAGYDRIDTTSMKYIDVETHNGFLKRSILEAGDVLISIAGTLGRTGLVREEDLPLNTNQAIAFVRMVTKFYVDVEYISYILNALTIQKELGNKKVAMAIPNLSLEVISKAMVPLPPFDEQKRIVLVIRKALDILNEIDDLQEKYCNDLTTLKSKIIDAGIRGKLTEQLPEDGDAETLYTQLQEEKAKLIKEGKIKKEKLLPDISADEIPFEIPKNWKWVRIGNITHNHGQKTPQNRFCYIDVGTLDNVNHKLNDNENVVEAKDAPSRAKKIVEVGDVLYSTVRPYLHNICVIDRSFTYEPIASTAFAVMHTFDDCLINRYLFYWLLSGWFDKYANGDSSKGALYPAIGEKDFFKGLMPLPPIEEQKRIVAKIEAILEQLN